MDSSVTIENLLRANRINISGTPVQDAGHPGKYFVFVQIDRDLNGRQRPSNRSLAELHSKLNAEGVELSFVLTEAGEEDALATVKAVLFRAFPDMVRNVFLSRAGGTTIAWIDPKTSFGEREDEVRQKVREALDLLGLQANEINFTTSDDVTLPTPTAVLRTVRALAPVSTGALQAELISKGFSVPDERWLNHLLDRHRKAGKVIRQKSGHFILTLDGLTSLGTIKSRRSPDVGRALDLARRRR